MLRVDKIDKNADPEARKVGLKDRQERPLPDYVQREFEDYLRCGRLEHGFLRVRCDTCHA